LLDPGEFAVDVGANIGHMTSIMAMRAGPSGQVMVFEPHPVLFSELQYNISTWEKNPHAAPILASKMALSDHPGSAQLMVPADFEGNHGVCSLESNGEANPEAKHIEVEVTTLSAMVDKGKQIGFLKIDVEGHELQVLLGAQDQLASGSIRDILFEEFRALPTPVTKLLQDNGYTIYRIVLGTFWGPVLAPIETYQAPADEKDSPNYLATRDPGRLLNRMSKRGWRVYSNRTSILK
jgi:FkbM family methyltransferase